jgi:5-(carboxyamino)imidazole ribonucleotide synthase
MIAPGSQIGLLGGGQLARMTALAGRRMGYRFRVFDPAGAAAPAAPVCERSVGAPFDDADALADFARGLDVIGFEFENIPPAALQALERFCPVRPSWRALEICQHREREKLFLERHGYPHAAFRVATDPAELERAIGDLGAPCVLKTAQSGYDGKGQLRIGPGLNADEAWRQWGGGPASRGVVEAWVDFEAELSVICARNPAGEIVAFPAIENMHTHHILDLSITPARFPPAILRQAGELAAAITETLAIEGLLAVEMFLTRAGELLVNELAPRPHNSGHLTFDAGLTSQFEQHIRAICGLPLGDPRLHTPAVMVNLLGQLWGPHFQAPDWLPVLAEPAAKLHLYGKQAAKPGRKMGHFCVLDPSREVALEKALAIKARLENAHDSRIRL